MLAKTARIRVEAHTLTPRRENLAEGDETIYLSGTVGTDDGDSTNKPPSVALTTKFLELWQQYGSEQLAVGIVAVRRSTAVPGLPQGNDWTAWNATRFEQRSSTCSTSWGGDAAGAVPTARVALLDDRGDQLMRWSPTSPATGST